MGQKQRLVVQNLAELGLINRLDAVDLKPNAMTALQNLKPKDGRLVCATRLGNSISASPVFSAQTYKWIRPWNTYGDASRVLLTGGKYMEWIDATSAYRSAVPHWLGVFGKTGASNVISGNEMGANYTSSDFAVNPATKMTTDDAVFVSSLGTLWIDEHTTAANGPLPAQWNQTSGTIAISSNKIVSGAGKYGWATHQTDSSQNPNNIFASIRFLTLDTASENGVTLFVRDSVTKRGYALDAHYCYELGAYGGPEEYVLRVYAGYLNAAALLNYSLLIHNDDSVNEDYNDFNDIWIWIRKPFITFGYGARAVYSCALEIDFEYLELGIGVSGSASIGPKQGATHNPIIAGVLTDIGPLTVSAVSNTNNTITTSTVTADKYGFIWGAKAIDDTDVIIRTATEYVLRLSVGTPLFLWKGGMLPEYCPNMGQPPEYPDYVGWGGNDVAIHDGSIIIGGAEIYATLLHPTSDYYEWQRVFGHPTRLMWCTSHDQDDWSDEDLSGFQELVETGGAIQAIRVLRDTLMVYKTDAIAQGIPSGQVGNPWTFNYYATGVGAASANSLVEGGTQHFFNRDGRLYEVTTNDFQPVWQATAFSTLQRMHPFTSDDSVVVGDYVVASTAFIGRAYNYLTQTAYDLYLPDVRAVWCADGYVCAVKGNGTVYGGNSQSMDVAGTYTALSEDMYFTLPELSFDTTEYIKEVELIDVFYRYSGSVRPRIQLTVVNEGSSTVLTAVAGEIIGDGLERATFHNVSAGLFYKFKIAPYDYAGVTEASIEFVRVEVEFASSGPDPDQG